MYQVTSNPEQGSRFPYLVTCNSKVVALCITKQEAEETQIFFTDLCAAHESVERELMPA